MESSGIRPVGGAARWWLHHSLTSLAAALVEADSTLTLRRGPAARVIRELAAETGAQHVLWKRRYGGPERSLDGNIKAWAAGDGIKAASFQANLRTAGLITRGRAGAGVRHRAGRARGGRHLQAFPHLRFGEISPFRVWHELRRRFPHESTPDVGIFRSELGWREFCWQLLRTPPATPRTGRGWQARAPTPPRTSGSSIR